MTAREVGTPAPQIAGGRSIAATIEALDPVRDSEAITHLSLGVRYGDAFFVHGAYTVAFARQVSIPSVARTVYRTGTGDMMKDVRRRNDHTLVFFGEMIRHGHSSQTGRRVIDRMEAIHSRFGITDDDKLYTLAALTFEPVRILDNLGLKVFTPTEDEAHYRFWRGVGEYMGLAVPQTRADYWAWVRDYERDRMAYTDGGRALVDQLFLDWRRWFPGPSRRLADPALALLLGEDLRRIFRLPDPTDRFAKVGSRTVQAYLELQALRPHRAGRSWSDGFVNPYGGHPVDISRYGHQAPAPRVAAAEEVSA